MICVFLAFQFESSSIHHFSDICCRHPMASHGIPQVPCRENRLQRDLRSHRYPGSSGTKRGSAGNRGAGIHLWEVPEWDDSPENTHVKRMERDDHKYPVQDLVLKTSSACDSLRDYQQCPQFSVSGADGLERTSVSGDRERIPQG